MTGEQTGQKAVPDTCVDEEELWWQRDRKLKGVEI